MKFLPPGPWKFSCNASMRLSACTTRSFSWSIAYLHNPSTFIFNDKRALSQIPQSRLAPFYETSEPPCHLRNSAKCFSSVGLDKLLDLPRSCPGCGAFTQSTSPDQPGFYGANRKAVQAFIAWSRSKQAGLKENTSGDAPESTYRFFPKQPNGDQGLDFSKGILHAFGRVTRCWRVASIFAWGLYDNADLQSLPRNVTS